MKKAILFDIDGTLLDAYDFLFDAVKHSIALHGYSYPTQEKIKVVFGKPLLEFYKTLFPEADYIKLAAAHREFQQETIDQMKLFPNAKKTLKALKNQGFCLAAVSNRTRKSLHYSLKQAKIFDQFDVVVSAEDVKNTKPHPEHPLKALNILKINPADAYMIGDTDQDMLAGKNAGLKTIGVTYGFLGSGIKDCKPDFVIERLEEVLEIVSKK